MLSIEPFKYVAVSHKIWHDCCMSRSDARRGRRPVAGASVSGLRVRVAPGSRFPLQVVGSDGIPEMPLTVFAEELRRMLSPGSA